MRLVIILVDCLETNYYLAPLWRKQCCQWVTSVLPILLVLPHVLDDSERWHNINLETLLKPKLTIDKDEQFPCGELFANTYLINKHIVCHKKSEDFRCKYCNKTFKLSHLQSRKKPEEDIVGSLD